MVHGIEVAPPPAPDTPSLLNGLRLLIVDDALDSAESFATLLRLAGAEVEIIDDRVRSFSLRFSGPLGTDDLVWNLTPG